MSSLLSIKDGFPEMKLSLGQSCVIGRSSECEIQLIDSKTSRRHALIYSRDGGYLLRDLDSRNGTFHNGVRIGDEVRLTSGDEILVGERIFIFDPPLEVYHDRLGPKSVYIVDEEGQSPAAAVKSHEKVNGLSRESLLAVHRLICQVAARLDLDRLLTTLMDTLMEHFAADRGFILAYEPKGQGFRPLAIRTEKRAMAVSRTLLQIVVENKKPLLMDDALEDVSFSKGRSIVEHELRSVMLVPLLREEEVIGLVQLDKQKKGAFNSQNLGELWLLSQAAALALANALRFENEKRKNISLVEREAKSISFVGQHPKILSLLAEVKKAAASSARVLVTGESGTGKELIARMIHDMGPRAQRPWVAVNCAAVPENLLESEFFGHEKGAFTGANRLKKGCFEIADKGALFLDEVAEISPALQVKLLRVLQEGCFFRVGGERPVEVDVRIIAATNRDIMERIRAGRFREDLYYRLNVIILKIPPLRERGEDAILLARLFAERYARELGKAVPELEPETVELFQNYHWPGNVRELQNVMERITVLCDRPIVRPDDLPPEIKRPTPSGPHSMPGGLRLALADVELELIRQALSAAKGKKVDAARILGISRPTLDKKIAEYGIDP